MPARSRNSNIRADWAWGSRPRIALRASVGESSAQASRNEITRIELEVFASNEAAIRLYESESFQHEGRKRKPRVPDGSEDDLVLMARLTP